MKPPKQELRAHYEPVVLRPAVQWFAEQMELALGDNDHKGGWTSCTPYWLLRRLRGETQELEREVKKRGHLIVREAADVANFALMIADKFHEGIDQ
jgi:hypothetical protein